MNVTHDARFSIHIRFPRPRRVDPDRDVMDIRCDVIARAVSTNPPRAGFGRVCSVMEILLSTAGENSTFPRAMIHSYRLLAATHFP